MRVRLEVQGEVDGSRWEFWKSVDASAVPAVGDLVDLGARTGAASDLNERAVTAVRWAADLAQVQVRLADLHPAGSAPTAASSHRQAGSAQWRASSSGTPAQLRRYPRLVPVGDEEVDLGWRFVSIGFEGDAIEVAGVNPWQRSWTPTHECITVAHPQYPSQRHVMFTYEIAGLDAPVVFAAGEFSNGVWGFYVPC